MKDFLILLLGLGLGGTATAQVLPNDAIVGGKTIREWSAEWVKWVVTAPIAQSPMLDTNGSFAAAGQPDGAVFFVAHTTGLTPDTMRRQFTVPEGKYLFFPLDFYEADNVNTVPPLSAAELRDQTVGVVDKIETVYATLDGATLVSETNRLEHRARSPVFNFFHSSTNNLQSYLFGGQPIIGCVDPAVTDGYWVMLEPLSPGQHLLSFGGSFKDNIFYPANIVDCITVVPASSAEPGLRHSTPVQGPTLPQTGKSPLVQALRGTQTASQRSPLEAGLLELRAFEREVGSEISGSDRTLAEEFLHAAHRISAKPDAQSR